MKITAAQVRKLLKTDTGKSSKAGRLKLVQLGGKLATVADDHPEPTLLNIVFRDGTQFNEPNWEQVKGRLENSL